MTPLPLRPTSPPTVRTTRLPSGEVVPVLGQGTWRMGEKVTRLRDEIAVLKLGIELGMTLIDTAEMYGDGGAETIVGKAIEGRRDQVFLVSKVLPRHATRRGTVTACEQSLRRLGATHLDLYLLHWRDDRPPLEETVEAFEALVQTGKIRYWGVSNFDMPDLDELWRLPAGSRCATNQVLYNLVRRGIEWDMLAWSAERHMPTMAYSPFEQGRLVDHAVLPEIAHRLGATPSQVALAWVMRRDGIIAIPKAGSLAHAQENRAALDLQLSAADLAALDGAFPPPMGPRPLETL